VGRTPVFDFEPLDHVDLGTSLGILDLERAAKISGARFSILTGKGARLERALINFCLELQTKRHGYEEILPRLIVNATRCMGPTASKFEGDLFKLTDERGFYLIPNRRSAVDQHLCRRNPRRRSTADQEWRLTTTARLLRQGLNSS